MTEPNTGPTPGNAANPDGAPSADHASSSSPSSAAPSGPDATQAIPSTGTTAASNYSYPTAESGSQAAAAPYAASPAPAGAGVELADEPQPARSGGGKRTGLLIGGLAAVLVLGGAGVFAAQQLSGGGTQPADVLPGDAYTYVRLDIDPSAGQKIAAVRFLDKLPQVKDTLTAGDPRKKLWELATKDAGNDCIAKFSYDSDIAPWLGDRVGAAIRPGGTEDHPNVAVAIQVKDENLAKDALTKLLACDKGSTGTDVRVKDGYAIVTPAGDGDATLAAVDKGSLSQNATFKDDMAALGEQGVASMWFDLGNGAKELQKLSGDAGSAAELSEAKGRVVAALRFDPDYVELAGLTRGTATGKASSGNGAELSNLPDDTAAALHVSGADQIIDNAWPTLKKQLDALASADGGSDAVGEIEQQLDIKLPDDLKVLLGRSFTVAVPQQDFSGDSVVVGGKIVTANPARAGELLDKVNQAAGSGVLTHSADGNKVYLATDPAYIAKLKAGGKLGDSDAFKSALGDVSTSNVGLFVDLDKLEKLYLNDVDPDQKAFVEALRAVGLSGSATGDGEAKFSLRVVGN